MLISQKHKVILIGKEHDRYILPAIPHAAPYKNYRVIPHRIDETIVLGNLGFDVPSPILYDYDFPGPFTPFAHQRETSNFFTKNPRAFCLNDIGTGKTLSAYWAADYLMLCRKLRRVLVVSPLSTLDRVHGDALVRNFPHRDFAILHGTAAKRQRLFEHDFDFYIINHDGVATITETYKKDGKLHTRLLRDDIDLIILDEFAVYRNGQTHRWKLMKRLIEPRQWVWGMSGKPTPTEPTDAYSEVKLINPAKVANYSSFRGFQTATMDQLNMYRWRAKPNAMDTVYSVLQPAIRFTRDECLDLPECLYETRTCELTPTQQKVYKDLAKEMVANVKGGKVTALNEGVLLMRLVQTASGVVYDVTGEHLEVDCAPRLAALEEIIEEANTKVIVFVPFVGNIEFLEKALSSKYSVATVYGGTPGGARSEIFKRFQDTPDPHVLVAHPACMAHGLTLTAAATIVWWAPITSNEIYRQAIGRIERIGQKHSMLICHLAGTKVEHKIYERLRQQEKLQGILLDMVRDASH